MFSVINVTYSRQFGGMRKDNSDTLIKADTTNTQYFFPVGIINHSFAPYFPGPYPFLNISEIQFFVTKDC